MLTFWVQISDTFQVPTLESKWYLLIVICNFWIDVMIKNIGRKSFSVLPILVGTKNKTINKWLTWLQHILLLFCNEFKYLNFWNCLNWFETAYFFWKYAKCKLLRKFWNVGMNTFIWLPMNGIQVKTYTLLFIKNSMNGNETYR